MLRWLEHKTNPLQVLCRVLDLVPFYEKLWRGIFCKNRSGGLSREDLVELVRLRNKASKLRAEIGRRK